MYSIIALLALSTLVFFHELGHFSAAKFFGVKVERFSIGFGRVLFKKEWLGTEWAFAPILLGGYVKLKGQDDINPLERSDDDDSYNSKKPWQRIVILLAGPAANIILAFFIYLFIALYGAPASTASGYITPTISKVIPNTPAQAAGLKSDDRVVKINNKPIRYWYQLKSEIVKSDHTITLDVKRGEELLHLKLLPKIEKRQNEFNETIEQRVIGITPKIKKSTIIEFGLIDAFSYALNETKNAMFLITKGVQKISTGEVDSKNIAGAITIFDLLISFAKAGFIYLLFIMALISVNLGILNLLPIPALDGGHIVFNIYEMVTKRAPSENILYKLTLAGWLFLIGLMVFGLYNDVNRIWG
ncbi:MAG TPA: RIP metalloprotease RseP [Nitratifractor sp.]|nr:RIP metalloprotease RseP [Nitratifractor sp.]